MILVLQRKSLLSTHTAMLSSPVLLPLASMLLGFPTSCLASYVSSLLLNSQSLFNDSMTWMGRYYDSSSGYLFDVSSATSLRHETRSSAWCAIGLLASNNGSDVDDAMKIIENVIAAQFTLVISGEFEERSLKAC